MSLQKEPREKSQKESESSAPDKRSTVIDLQPGEGARFYMERPLPFLLLYRTPPDGKDRFTRYLGMTEAAYFSTGSMEEKEICSILQDHVLPLSKKFGGFLLIEVWVNQQQEDADFTIHYKEESPLPVVSFFKKRLSRLKVDGRKFTAATVRNENLRPDGLSALDFYGEYEESEVMHLGLEITPSWEASKEEGYYPVYLRLLRRALAVTLKQVFYEYIRLETAYSAAHFHGLGSTRIEPLIHKLDDALADIGQKFQLLELVTPTNIDKAWQEFKDSGYTVSPTFHYRHLPVDPEKLKKELFSLPIEKVADPTFAFLLRDKRDEMAKMVTMLADREQKDFRYGSMLLYGNVNSRTVSIARALLTAIPAPLRAVSTSNHYDTNDEEEDISRLDAKGFLSLANEEVNRLSEQDPEIRGKTELVKGKGLRVTRGVLQVGRDLDILASRAEALIQHEVGTHMVTYYNGLAQPFRIFSSGVPGYEELQEGLAVLSEYLVGGLTNSRLRTLAARVVAVDAMVGGSDFPETFRLLTEKYYFTPYTAYTICMRVYRGGGFTKDAVYLKGLICLLDHLGNGGEIRPLLVGKIRQDYLDIVQELQHRSVLRPLRIVPGFLEKAPEERLLKLKEGLNVFKMIN